MSNLMLRRETIIALRARHTAFRIAIDILYPQQPPPPTPQPAIPVTEDAQQARAFWEDAERARADFDQARARGLRWFILILFAALLVLIVYAVWDATHPRAVPLIPQARPIPAQTRS